MPHVLPTDSPKASAHDDWREDQSAVDIAIGLISEVKRKTMSVRTDTDLP